MTSAIQDYINSLKTIKKEMMVAIKAKGSDINESTPLEQYADKINNIKGIDYAKQMIERNIKSIIISNDITSIGAYAFSNCQELVSVSIPNSVTFIGNYAFYVCSNLVSVSIPNSVPSIEDGVFSHCSKLASITIPNSVASITNYAFYGCTSLKSIIINRPKDSISGARWGAPSTTQIIWNG